MGIYSAYICLTHKNLLEYISNKFMISKYDLLQHTLLPTG